MSVSYDSVEGVRTSPEFSGDFGKLNFRLWRIGDDAFKASHLMLMMLLISFYVRDMTWRDTQRCLGSRRKCENSARKSKFPYLFPLGLFMFMSFCWDVCYLIEMKQNVVWVLKLKFQLGFRMDAHSPLI